MLHLGNGIENYSSTFYHSNQMLNIIVHNTCKRTFSKQNGMESILWTVLVHLLQEKSKCMQNRFVQFIKFSNSITILFMHVIDVSIFLSWKCTKLSSTFYKVLLGVHFQVIILNTVCKLVPMQWTIKFFFSLGLVISEFRFWKGNVMGEKIVQRVKL